MIARTRWMNWIAGALILGLSVMLLAGCRSDSGSRSSGCGGGCCRGQSCEIGAGLSLATGTPVRSDPEQQRTDAEGQAGKELPATTANTPTQELYRGQKTCPVTGDDLGSMGPAIPVTVKGNMVYVCCRGCAAKVQRDSDTYLAKVMVERAGR